MVMRLALAIVVVLPVVVFGQDPPMGGSRKVLDAILSNSPQSEQCFDDSAVAVANRLGIVYDGVYRKCMISYDLEDSVKAQLTNKVLDYAATVEPCGGEYQLLTVSIPKLAISYEFYLRKDRLTSPLFALTRDWRSSSSQFFRFAFADSTITNPYAIAMLDQFVLRVGAMLGFNLEDFTILETRKILYYLCRDETEILRLTGFRTRGMYNLAYDAIVSTYNTHFHELVHLLVNFKLRNVQLYAHPFLQEGLAVALGGRGGLSSDVVVKLGAYLDESQMLQLSGLLRRSEFASVDASLSYPLAGLYNRFLLQALGAEKYLALYRKHCGLPTDIGLEEISQSELPNLADWHSFRQENASGRTIQLLNHLPDERIIRQSEKATVADMGDRYQFAISGALLFGPCDTLHARHSRKFSELFPERDNSGHRYLAMADSQTVSVYDLWTNTLIASYVASFEMTPRPVRSQSGKFLFAVMKSVFPGEVAEDSFCPMEGLAN
jgi:hypothetical protein